MSERRTSSVFDPIRVLGVIAAVLLVAGVAFEIGHVTRNDDTKNSSAAGTTTTIKPQVLGTQITSPDETSTTAAQTPTTAAPATTTTVAAAVTATTVARATTTTTRPPARSCGTGQATAQASNSVSPGASAGTWKSSGEADVNNGTDRTLVIDKLTLRLNYTDGSSDTFTPDGAVGAQVQPSQIKGFPFTRTTAKQGSTVDIIEFQVHPAGSGPECESQPA